jgi:EAL domain-containing protein (putative c-di-GMP-specific phosphodiesterase class I)
VLELTEREAVEDMERLIRAVEACRAAGMRIAADDVGAGNAGLRLLAQIRFDIVKVIRLSSRAASSAPRRRRSC